MEETARFPITSVAPFFNQYLVSWHKDYISPYHCLHYLHHSLAPGKQHGGNTAPPINRRLDERFTELGPPLIRTRPSFPLRQSLLIRGQTEWKPLSQETKQTWTTALSNSVKLWAMLCRAAQDGRVMVESSDKTWSTGEGNGKPVFLPWEPHD